MIDFDDDARPIRDGGRPIRDSGRLSTNLLSFIHLLRRAGMAVAVDQTLAVHRALELIDLTHRDQFFYAARAMLVTRKEDLELFESLFNGFWSPRWGREGSPPRATPAPRAPRHDPQQGRPFTIVSYLAWKARNLEREVDVTDRAQTYSEQEVLQSKDFSLLDPQELETVRRMMQDLQWPMAERPSRRRRRAAAGRFPDLRATLRRAASRGGVPAELFRAEPKTKQRPIVLLADISGSMEKLSRLMLQFFYGVEHSLGEVESFVFGTRLTRITHHLKLRNIDRALDSTARNVGDWAGGTRIGECLAEFNRRWSRRVLRRGAVVIVLSDGWEQGDCRNLALQVAQIRRRCRRLIWLNPLSGRAGYRPEVAGMAAALPHVDDFLPVSNLQSLQQLAGHLADLPARRSPARRPPVPRSGSGRSDSKMQHPEA